MPDSSTDILLLGGTGQIGYALHQRLSSLGTTRAPRREQVDLTEPDTLKRAVEETMPDAVVNAAAYTDVDGAEEEPDRAALINAKAPGILAEASASVGAWFVHYSTDYVFDGTKRTPYTESDPPCPPNVYGRTKLQGEEAVRAAGGKYLILRTSWIYSNRRSNFLRTMLKLADDQAHVTVVDDQFGSPTWAGWVAEATTEVLRTVWELDGEGPVGTYHVAAAGQTSWYGFAQAIFDRFGREDVSVQPVSSEEYPTTASRPDYAVLSSDQLCRKFDVSVSTWEEQLARCHEQITSTGRRNEGHK